MLAEVIHKTLTPQISPMVYIMMSVSVFIGFCFATDTWVGPEESVVYSSGVMVNPNLWGLLLTTTATAAIVGFARCKDWLIQFGGISGFMLWLFACIAVLDESHWYIFFSVTFFHLVFHGYVTLASSLGYLRRQPII